MSADYRIAAIPTEYRGRRYRSRLEARWAAFFDMLGWRHEYEPFDLGKWSPDFRFVEADVPNALVEVKPTDFVTNDVVAKIVTACADRMLDYSETVVLITSSSPVVMRAPSGARYVSLGKCLTFTDDHRAGFTFSAVLWTWPKNNRGSFPSLGYRNPSARHSSLSWIIHNYQVGDFPSLLNRFEFNPDEIMRIWAEASNRVQWSGQ